MKKELFSQNELMELEALEVRGGASSSDDSGQEECVNKVEGCGYGASQYRCSNTATACTCSTITQKCDNNPNIKCPK